MAMILLLYQVSKLIATTLQASYTPHHTPHHSDHTPHHTPHTHHTTQLSFLIASFGFIFVTDVSVDYTSHVQPLLVSAQVAANSSLVRSTLTLTLDILNAAFIGVPGETEATLLEIKETIVLIFICTVKSQ